MDIEFIRTSPTHRCIRKIYILAKNGIDELELEFYPCKRYEDLEPKYQRSFRFCRDYIHKLTYNPRSHSPLCANVVSIINNFFFNNDIDAILYKGGTIERDLCKELHIPSINIECIEELEKAGSHNPAVEVNCYYGQIIGYSYL